MAVVFGGSGYIGAHICRQLAAGGKRVRSISRRGRPLWVTGNDEWEKKVDWVSGDMFQPKEWEECLDGVEQVVISVGAFGSNEFMERVCGDGPVAIVEAAARRNPRCVVTFVSSEKAQSTPEFFLRGYFQGKKKMENRMKELFPASHLILQPGFVFGPRHIGGNGQWIIPLQLIGHPLRSITLRLPQALRSIPFIGQGLVPATNVEDISTIISEVNPNAFKSRTLSSRDIYEEALSLHSRGRSS